MDKCHTMIKGKRNKSRSVAPKEGNPRITAFFKSHGNSVSSASTEMQNKLPVAETTSQYFQGDTDKPRMSMPSKLSLKSTQKPVMLPNIPSTSSNIESHDNREQDQQGKRKNDTPNEIPEGCSKRTKLNIPVNGNESDVLIDESEMRTEAKADPNKHCDTDCFAENSSNEPGQSLKVGDTTCDRKLSDTDNCDLTEMSSNEATAISNLNCKSCEQEPSSSSKIQHSEGQIAISQSTEEICKSLEDANDNDEVTEGEEYRIPYYLENFTTIVNYVMTDEFYAYLFNEEDRETVEMFQNLTESGQKLYVRLFGRQYRWLRKSKIVYAKISDDLTHVLDELVKAGLVDDEKKLVDLSEILWALPVPDLKTLGKSLRLNVNQLREDLISSVIKHCSRTNINTFFKTKNSSSSSGTNQAIVQRAKKLLGECYRLCKRGRSVFMRTTMLFSLHRTHGEEDERGGGQAQLFQMLMSNIGKVKYPDYKVNRHTKIFQDRESLQSFSSALQLEMEIVDALERKDYDAALEHCKKAKEKLGELRQSDEAIRHDRSLPSFLRVCTSGAVYTRVLSQGVELFQFKKQYSEAIEQLKDLIAQDLYHLDYRGRWYERLVLNLDHHVKKPSEALDYVKVGLADGNIRVGHRYALFQRAQKICHAPSNKKLRKRWQEFSEDVMALVAEAPKTFIKRKRLDNVRAGGYAMFITESSLSADNDEVTFLKRVEDVALNYYKEQGFPEGIHAEGGIISLLFTLLMWDIIFCDEVPDVFYNLYQTLPLDLYTEDFYLNRKTAIDDRLKEISLWTEEELCNVVGDVWVKHFGTLCVGINWELFEDVEHLQGLCRCMGPNVLTSVFDRMARDLRFTRSGVPDLTVWNPVEKTFKIVEVKGPGDRLSTKQILWLDYLINVGVKAEVCHVQAVGAKKIH